MPSELLTKIKAADRPALKPVEVPEWNLTVYLRQMTVGERDSFEQEMSTRVKGNQLDNPRSRFLVRVLCDEKGEPLCSVDDFSELSSLGSKPMERLFELAQKVNRIGDDDLEELAKN